MTEEYIALEVDRLIEVYEKSSGILVKFTNYAGSFSESIINKFPPDWKTQIELATEKALHHASEAASNSHSENEGNKLLGWARGKKWHSVAAGVSGVVTGFIGLPGAIIDIPVSTTLLLRSIQEVASEHGEDVHDIDIRKECISILGLGDLNSLGSGGLGIASTRIAVSGQTLTQIISRVLPQFTSQVTQKILAQAMPLVGALAGGGVNALFSNYYRTLAEVHFGLKKLGKETGIDVNQIFSEKISERRRERASDYQTTSSKPSWAIEDNRE